MNCFRPRLISRCAAASSSVSSLSLSYLGCSWQSFLSWASTLSFFTSSTVASASSSSPSISSTIPRCKTFCLFVCFPLAELRHQYIFKGQCCHQKIFHQLTSSSSDDDGWQPQVLDLPRGVHLCRHRHLPRHPQPLPSQSQACCRCKEMIDFVSLYLIQLSNNNLSHYDINCTIFDMIAKMNEKIT